MFNRLKINERKKNVRDLKQTYLTEFQRIKIQLIYQYLKIISSIEEIITLCVVFRTVRRVNISVNCR